MLPSDFGNLAKREPTLKVVLPRLEQWAKDHAQWTLIDPRKVARDIDDVDPLLLALALESLVRAGLYQRVYMVVTPSGVLADGEYNDLQAIPPRVPDRFNEYFATEDTDIVPVLKPAR
jgi:hypothetical protein